MSAHNRKPITDHVLRRCEKLRELGLTWKVIAARFSLNESTLTNKYKEWERRRNENS